MLTGENTLIQEEIKSMKVDDNVIKLNDYYLYKTMIVFNGIYVYQ